MTTMGERLKGSFSPLSY